MGGWRKAASETKRRNVEGQVRNFGVRSKHDHCYLSRHITGEMRKIRRVRRDEIEKAKEKRKSSEMKKKNTARIVGLGQRGSGFSKLCPKKLRREMENSRARRQIWFVALSRFFKRAVIMWCSLHAPSPHLAAPFHTQVTFSTKKRAGQQR